MPEPSSWLALAVDGNTQHGGNDGYNDDVTSSYEWDTTVPHCREIAPRDRLVLWNKTQLIGVSVIDDIELVVGITKMSYRCPNCSKSHIKQRQTRSPRYRCYSCRSTFDEPNTSEITVDRYKSRHEARWVDLRGLLDGAELRQLCYQPKSQQSFRRIDWEGFASLVRTRSEFELPALDWLQRSTSLPRSGHRRSMTRVRIGQGEFRKKVLSEFGSACAISGPLPEAVLEACHLYSYSEVGVHHSDGGLLLRSDLHKLFDQGLIAIDPDRSTIDVSPTLSRYPSYSNLQGQPLVVELGPGHLRWLRRRWESHRGC